ncbi:hypothetical protein B0H13DRAFT_1850279 [Mycena leptocephala]|nr:hypothetical protein B0H13DRAFT_1850279 [Mycena leptocephala]
MWMRSSLTTAMCQLRLMKTCLRNWAIIAHKFTLATHAENISTSKKRKNGDLSDGAQEARKRRREMSPRTSSEEGATLEVHKNNYIAAKVRATQRGAKVWAKLEQAFLGNDKEYLLQDADALRVWLWRYKLQRRFFPRQVIQEAHIARLPKESDTVDRLFTTMERYGHIDIRDLKCPRKGFGNQVGSGFSLRAQTNVKFCKAQRRSVRCDILEFTANNLR